MKRLFLTTLCLAFVLQLVGVQSAAHARVQRGDTWVLLKTETIDLTKGFAEIDLSKTKGAFKALRFRLLRLGIAFKRIDITYTNDDAFVLERRVTLRRGRRTNAIDLRNKNRFLETLSLEFIPWIKRKEKTRLQIYGLQSKNGRLANRSNQNDSGQSNQVITPAQQPANKARPTTAADKSKITTDKTVDIALATQSRETISRPAKPEPKLLPSAAASLSTNAADNKHVLFAADYINFATGAKVVDVGKNMGKFNRIRLRISGNNVDIKDVDVRYAKGGLERFSVNKRIRSNRETDWFILDGDEAIDSLHVSYKTRQNFKGKARVEAYGEFSETWLKTTQRTRNDDGWVLIGAQAAGFAGFDQDTVSLKRDDQRFSSLKVRVRDRAITLSEVRVVYGDGKVDIIPVKTRVDAGKTFGPIGIPRQNQQITEIQARYRSLFIDRKANTKGSAVVEFWVKESKASAALQGDNKAINSNLAERQLN